MKKCHECDFASQGDRRELSGKLFYLDRGELESAANSELRPRRRYASVVEGEEDEEWGDIVEQHAFLARPNVRRKREAQRTISGNKCDRRACPGMRTSVYTPTLRIFSPVSQTHPAYDLTRF